MTRVGGRNGSRSKTNTSIRIYQDQYEFLQEHDEYNASGLFRQFMDEFMENGSRPDGLEFRREMLEQEREQKESELERIERQLERIDEEREDREENREENVVEALDALDSITPRYWGPDNDAIINAAMELNMSAEELIEVYEERRGPKQVGGVPNR